MKTNTQIIIFLSFFIFSCSQSTLDGKEFVGFENEIYSHGGQSFETTLTFKSDTVFIKKRPISKNEKDTLEFTYGSEIYTYKGIVKSTDDSMTFKAFAFKCDDCNPIVEIKENGEIVEVLEDVTYKGIRLKNGMKLNNNYFKVK